MPREAVNIGPFEAHGLTSFSSSGNNTKQRISPKNEARFNNSEGTGTVGLIGGDSFKITSSSGIGIARKKLDTVFGVNESGVSKSVIREVAEEMTEVTNTEKIQEQVIRTENTAESTGAGENLTQNNEDRANEMTGQKERVYQYLVDLTNSSKREMALSKLSKYRETFPDLAPLLWHSFGCIAALLQEIISTYQLLSPPSLSNQASNRTCNSLALLQCIASHPETRGYFLSAQIPLYLYPFLNTVTKSRPFEYLRLTSLGVIGALVKVDDPEIVSFLLQTEIIPLCLRVMETGSELSKTVATFIIQKILLDDIGLSYICATPERFFTVCQVLGNVITQHNEAPSPRLLKHIIRCYLRLSENQKVRDPLKQIIPPIILTSNFKLIFHDDIVTTKWLHQLYANIC